jgi:hypothetical protein
MKRFKEELDVSSSKDEKGYKLDVSSSKDEKGYKLDVSSSLRLANYN